jgi:mannose-6-phosphate isomerase-like protein (cupin superfamily)
MNRLTITDALTRLKGEKEPFKTLLSHGSMRVEIYKPDAIDLQQPHSRDELYIIASGSGFFINGESRERVEQGEVLFVPAGIVHRFEDFTKDFSTWVIFYGPEGGEENT